MKIETKKRKIDIVWNLICRLYTMQPNTIIVLMLIASLIQAEEEKVIRSWIISDHPSELGVLY